MDLDKILASLPVDKLAAIGLTGREDNDYVQELRLEKPLMTKVAQLYKEETGMRHMAALNHVARALGYDNFKHYNQHRIAPGVTTDSKRWQHEMRRRREAPNRMRILEQKMMGGRP